jgi:lactate permease
VTWTQSYTPLGNLYLSALVAALPVVVLLGLLGIAHVKAHWAALAGLATALLVAMIVFGMPPLLAVAAATNGAAYGLFPIGWIVVGAIFIYDITLFTGKFEVVKETIAGLASDRRLQLLLIAFSFGAFIEGAAGFGTPVAISAAMLIGLGFRPLPAAGLSLIGNTAPVAFGALASPLIALSGVTKLPLNDLSAMVGRQLPIFSLIIPFWLVWAMAGRKSMLEVWPACLTSGLSFAVVQFFWSNFVGPQLVDIMGALVSILCTVVLLRFWQPATIWRFPHDEESAPRSVPVDARPPTAPARPATQVADTLMPDMEGRGPAGATPVVPAGAGAAAMAMPSAGMALPAFTQREAFIAWLPWLLLSIFVFLWGIPEIKNFLNSISVGHVAVPFVDPAKSFSAPATINWPYLDKAVFRAPPVVPQPTAEAATLSLNWLQATGTALLIAGIIGGLSLGLNLRELVQIFVRTLSRVRFSLLTIAAMLALGYTTRYAGLDATMGLAFASTGFLFPFFSPLLGWLGVALTGSDTSSNVLFGNLQQITAQQLNINPILAAASNSSGGVMGKMIDAQSIVVAGVATGQQGGEGNILRYVFFHSLVLACLVGVVVFIQAYLIPWVVPVVK